MEVKIGCAAALIWMLLLLTFSTACYVFITRQDTTALLTIAVSIIGMWIIEATPIKKGEK